MNILFIDTKKFGAIKMLCLKLMNQFNNLFVDQGLDNDSEATLKNSARDLGIYITVEISFSK